MPGSGGQSTPAPIRPATTTSQVEIPLSLVGNLTQDNEAPVRQISAETGAIIQIRQDMQHFGYSLCLMTGTPDKLAKATELVKQRCGLSGGSVTKEVETSADIVAAQKAVELGLVDMRKRKTGDVPVRVLPPDAPGARLRISIGPGPVHLVSMAEQLIRKKVTAIELDLCYKQKRPVPIDMKVAVLCKYFEAGTCTLGGGCMYSHGAQEFTLVQRAHMPAGAENARGTDSASLVANIPRWPPLPGDIKALAPMESEEKASVLPSEVMSTSLTSGMI